MGLRGKRAEEKDSREGARSASRDADLSQLDDGVEIEINRGGGAGDLDEEQDKIAATDGDDGEIKRLKDEIAKLQTEVASFKDKYLRALADHENAVKRSIKERSELKRYEGSDIIIDLLEVIDSFERAIEYSDGDSKQFKDGVKLIHKQLVDALAKREIRSEPAIGTQFDPNKHRAIAKAKADGQNAGTVVGELKKPYRYKDKLLRFGEVVVAEPDDESTSEQANSEESSSGQSVSEGQEGN